MHLTHKIRLKPTAEHIAYFVRASGTARAVWNWGLAEWNRQYAAGGKPNAMQLRKEFNAIKYKQFPWIEEIHKDAHARPFTILGNAFSKFFRKTARRPKFKCKGKCADSFYVANDRMTISNTHVTIPRGHRVRLQEPLRLTGKVMSAVITRQGDHWYIAIAVDVGDYRKLRTGNEVAGVDLGVKTLATIANCREIVRVANPRSLVELSKKLRRAHRVLARRKRGSANRQKAKERLARVHARIRDVRHDCIHKLTTKLCRENQAVVIEDLCVKGMLKNRCLARAVHDAAFYEIRRQLEYKKEIYGTQVIIADRWFPSSKLCSRCGEKNEGLTLSDRVFECPACGRTRDRDDNAAVNLHTLGLREINACGPEGSGQTRKGKAKPRRVEAGTRSRMKIRN